MVLFPVMYATNMAYVQANTLYNSYVLKILG